MIYSEDDVKKAVKVTREFFRKRFKGIEPNLSNTPFEKLPWFTTWDLTDEEFYQKVMRIARGEEQ